MPNKFYIADLHFGHPNIITFLREDGTPERPFQSLEEMEEAIIQNWNGVVQPTDKVYVLGDVVIKRKALTLLNRLNGTKSLVRGNHDVYKIKEYEMYFKTVHTYRVMPGMILSHIPIHPSSVGRYGVNVHGHTHRYSIKDESGVADKRYFCVSADQINFTPIEDAELRNRIAAQYPEWLDRSLASNL